MDNGSYSYTITVLDIYHKKHEFTIAGYDFPEILDIFETSSIVEKYRVTLDESGSPILRNTHKNKYLKWTSVS